VKVAQALEATRTAALPEIVGEEMRIAMQELARITGRVDVEDLLDVVFRDFCIGK
jgi:tRNA modification GTPase